jgi:integrase
MNFVDKKQISKDFKEIAKRHLGSISEFALFYSFKSNGIRENSTTQSYVFAANKLEDIYGKIGSRKITKDLLEDFVGKLKDENFYDNTIKVYLTSIKTLLRRAKDYGLKIDPQALDVNFRPMETLKLHLTVEEIKKILGAKERTDTHKCIKILIYTGVRFSDLKQCIPENIHEGKLRITTKKNRKATEIPVPRKAIELINQRPKLSVCHSALNISLKEYCRKIGLRRGVQAWSPEHKKYMPVPLYTAVSPHVLRRAFCRMMWEGGKDLFTISKWASHRSVEQTQTYLPDHVEGGVEEVW